ncbi:MAG: leishmanolysin-related zinc metalloendopeptidase [Gemmatimonadales bacterium]
MYFVPAFRQTKAAGFGLAAAVTLTLVLSCASTEPPPPPPPPAAVGGSAGDNQTAAAGGMVPVAPAVRVTDAGGAPVRGVTVTFAVASGGGSLTGGTPTSDGQGIATVGSWTLGPTVGTNTLTATVSGLAPFTFTATGIAGAPATMTISAGDGQSATAGTAVATAPAVLVEDQFTNPVPGVSVTFTPSGDGQVTGSPATTDASGIATVGNWTMATAPGGNTLDADAGGLTTVTFNATGTLLVLNIAILQGNDQTGPLTGPLPTNPTVRVTDQGTGNPVSGVSVSFTPRSGEGTVNSATVVTDANGDAAVQWTPGRSGSNFMDVVAGNASTQFFSIGSNANYNIELRFLSAATMAQKQAFGNAAGDWMTAIGGDLAAIDFSSSPFPNSCGGFFGEPVLDTFVDDLLIWVVFAAIDGPGGVLAQSGPCLIRTAGSLPLVGGMQFDTADLPPPSGSLEDLVLHEIGHGVGFSKAIWNLVSAGLIQNESCGTGPLFPAQCDPDNPGADTHFSGGNANTQWTLVGGGGWMPPTSATSPVPLENTAGGPGGRDSHWRESTLVNEFMTLFVTSGPTGSNLFSIVTMGLFQDLGYTAINYGSADLYDLATDGNPSGLRAGPALTIELKDDALEIPLGVVDPSGRIVRYILP